MSEEYWERTRYQIEQFPLVQQLERPDLGDLSHRILDSTVSFLLCCAPGKKGDPPLSASVHIDWGWHWLMLDWDRYEAWCLESLGRVVKHVPFHPVLDAHLGGTPADARARVQSLMVRYGYPTDWEVWDLPAHGYGASGTGDDACSHHYI